jgi:hypothetical protein
MSKRQTVRSQASEQASQHCGWRSAEVKDDSKIFMATWEIADAVELVDAEHRPASGAGKSGEPAQAA